MRRAATPCPAATRVPEGDTGQRRIARTGTALLLAAPLLLAGCTGSDPEDERACAGFEEIQDGIEPVIADGLPAAAEADALDQTTQDLLSQWTFDLADLAQLATDTDLRALLRRAADEAHTAYAGNEGSLAAYTDLVDGVRARCAELGAAG